MKKYLVTFKETYEYTKEITTEDSEDIETVIRDPFEYPMIAYLKPEQFESLGANVCCEYNVERI